MTKANQINMIQSDHAKMTHHNEENYHFETLAIHRGQEADPVTGAVVPPLQLASTFQVEGLGKSKGYEYARSNNPNRSQLELTLASLENAKHCISFASGMSAISNLLNVVPQNATLVSMDGIYGGSWRCFNQLERMNRLTVMYGDLNDTTWLEEVLGAHPEVWIWIETPSNPLLQLVDITKVSEVAHRFGAKVAVDNTFMSPYFQKPLNLGADFVIHSGTKYISGHSDNMIGFVMTNDDGYAEALYFTQTCFGGVPSAFNCFLASRSLKTLGIRMRAHETNSFHIAEYLEAHPKIERVYFTGLKSHPQYALACRQQLGHCGIVTFQLKQSSRVKLDQFLGTLKLFRLGESLGGVESLIAVPCEMSHKSVPSEFKERWGIEPGVIRLSCGIEYHEDLVKDLECALNAVE